MSCPINNVAFVRQIPMRVNLRAQVLAGPLTGRARVLARCEDVPSLQAYSDHSIDKHARLQERLLAWRGAALERA